MKSKPKNLLSKKWWKNFTKLSSDNFIDWIFPKVCFYCQGEGHYLCNFAKLANPGKKYFIAKKGWNLDGLYWATDYKNEVIREAVHYFKYESVKDIGIELAKFLWASLGKKLSSNALLIAVPLYRKRLNERGFNQSEVMVDNLTQFGLQKIVGLVRTKRTRPQISLEKEQRIENIKNAFVWQGDNTVVKNKIIYLVDDVATTGSTLNEGAGVLKKYGAFKVYGLVVAKD